MVYFHSFFSIQNVSSNEIFINASSVEVDKESKIIYAKGNVEIFDKLENIIYTEEAEYDKVKGIVKTIGPTKIQTSEKYHAQGKDMFQSQE